MIRTMMAAAASGAVAATLVVGGVLPASARVPASGTTAGVAPRAAPAPFVTRTFSASPVPVPSTASPAPYVPWNAAYCATGGFGALTVDDHGVAHLPASVTLCSTYATKFTFSVAAFHAESWSRIISPDRLRQYAPSGPADFVVDVSVNPGYPRPAVGLCLMRSTTTRIACARIDVAADGRSATATAIGVDDPFVADEVSYDGALTPRSTDPACGTCL